LAKRAHFTVKHTYDDYETCVKIYVYWGFEQTCNIDMKSIGTIKNSERALQGTIGGGAEVA